MNAPPPGSVRLGDLAHARSGDKGDRANIGVVADDPARYRHLQEHLTAEAVAAFLAPMGVGPVTRYELPRIRALNFVVERALAGGASRSLRLDTQGKALGTALMELRLPAPAREESDHGPANHQRAGADRHPDPRPPGTP